MDTYDQEVERNRLAVEDGQQHLQRLRLYKQARWATNPWCHEFLNREIPLWETYVRHCTESLDVLIVWWPRWWPECHLDHSLPQTVRLT